MVLNPMRKKHRCTKTKETDVKQLEQSIKALNEHHFRITMGIKETIDIAEDLEQTTIDVDTKHSIEKLHELRITTGVEITKLTNRLRNQLAIHYKKED